MRPAQRQDRLGEVLRLGGGGGRAGDEVPEAVAERRQRRLPLLPAPGRVPGGGARNSGGSVIASLGGSPLSSSGEAAGTASPRIAAWARSQRTRAGPTGGWRGG